MFFLHDGRTNDLLTAITAHASQSEHDSDMHGRPDSNYPPSEATAVIRKFHALSASDKQAILDFLRSL
jgi:CxxC motif-containing protein (DUF1111 family)